MTDLLPSADQQHGFCSTVVSKIMKKNPHAKTEAEITTLVNEMKSVKFFEKYNTPNDQQILRQCCSVGEKFYIIVDGKVGVDVRLDKKDEALKRVKVLSKGQSFGEIALIYKKPRLATIQCVTRCTFAVLQQKHFQSTIQQTETNMMIKDMHTFFTMALFNQWTPNMLRELYLNSVWLTFKKGQQVYDLGEQADSMYVIQEGEFVVYSKLSFDKPKEDVGALSMKRLRSNKDNNGTGQYFKVKILCTGEYFGEEEILKKIDRQYRIQCNSFEGKVLMIKRQHFLNNVLADPSSKSYIQNRLDDKVDKAQQRIQQMKDSLQNYQSFLFQQPQEAIAKQPLFKRMPSLKESSLPSFQPSSSSPTHEKGVSPLKLLRGNSSSTNELNSPLRQKKQEQVPQSKQQYSPMSSLTTIDVSEYQSPMRQSVLSKSHSVFQSPEISSSQTVNRPNFMRLGSMELLPCFNNESKDESNRLLFRKRQNTKLSVQEIGSAKDIIGDNLVPMSPSKLRKLISMKSMENLSPYDLDGKQDEQAVSKNYISNRQETNQMQSLSQNPYFSQLVSLRVIEEEAQKEMNQISSFQSLTIASHIDLDSQTEYCISPREKRVSFQNDSNQNTRFKLIERAKGDDQKRRSPFGLDISPSRSPLKMRRTLINTEKQRMLEQQNYTDTDLHNWRIPEDKKEDVVELNTSIFGESLPKQQELQDTKSEKRSLNTKPKSVGINDNEMKEEIQSVVGEEVSRREAEKQSFVKELLLSPYLRKKILNIQRTKSVRDTNSLTVNLEFKQNSSKRRMEKKRKDNCQEIGLNESMMTASVGKATQFESESLVIISQEGIKKRKEGNDDQVKDGFMSFVKAQRRQQMSQQQQNSRNQVVQASPSQRSSALSQSRSSVSISQIMSESPMKSKDNYHQTIHLKSIPENKKKIFLNYLSREKVQDYVQNQLTMHRFNKNMQEQQMSSGNLMKKYSTKEDNLNRIDSMKLKMDDEPNSLLIQLKPLKRNLNNHSKSEKTLIHFVKISAESTSQKIIDEKQLDASPSYLS